MKCKKPLKLLVMICALIALLAGSLSMLGCNPGATGEVIYTFGAREMTRTQNPFVAGGSKQDMNSIVQVYEPLIVHMDMYSEVIPLLAESWEWNETDVSYTFHLDKRAKFSNNTAVTAEDVKYSCETAFNVPKHPGLSGVVDSIEVIDTRTVKFKLKEPSLLFMELIGNLVIVPKHIWTEIADIKTHLNENPVGSGPYFWTEYYPDSHCTFVRNPNYWKGADYWKGAGKITKVILKLYGTEEGMLMAFRRGDIEAMGDVLVSSVPQLMMDRNISVYFSSQSTGNIVMFNLRVQPFNLLKVRQAMDIAINRNAIIQNVLQGYGADPQQAPVAPCEPHSNPAIKWPYSDKTQTERAALANALMDEITDMSKTPSPIPSGWVRTYKGTPLQFDFDMSTAIQTVQVSDVIISSLATIGIKLNSKPGSFVTAYAKVFRHEGKNPSGWSVFYSPHGGINGFREDWMEPEPAPLAEGGYWRPKLYKSEAIGYTNAAMHTKMKQAITTMDVDARKVLDYQAQQMFAADMPVITLYHSLMPSAHRNDKFTGWLRATSENTIAILYGETGIGHGLVPMNTLNLRLVS